MKAKVRGDYKGAHQFLLDNRKYWAYYLKSKGANPEKWLTMIPIGVREVYDAYWKQSMRPDNKNVKLLVDIMDRMLGKSMQPIDVTTEGESLGRLILDKRADGDNDSGQDI